MAQTGAGVAARRTPGAARLGGERFFLVMSGLFLFLAVAGFFPSFYLRRLLWPDVFNASRHGAALPGYLYLHGVALTAWFTIAFTQATLVATRRTPLHRTLGVAGLVVAVAVVVTSLVTTAFRDAPLLAGQPGRSFPQILTVTTFAVCVTAGALLRRRPAEHKRLMLFASIAVIGPAVSRLLSNVGVERYSQVSATLILAMVASIPARDLLTRRRVHRGSLLGLLAILVGFATAYVATSTPLWPALARLLAGA